MTNKQVMLTLAAAYRYWVPDAFRYDFRQHLACYPILKRDATRLEKAGLVEKTPDAYWPRRHRTFVVPTYQAWLLHINPLVRMFNFETLRRLAGFRFPYELEDRK